jgi:hypothetical protein
MKERRSPRSRLSAGIALEISFVSRARLPEFAISASQFLTILAAPALGDYAQNCFAAMGSRSGRGLARPRS